MLDVFVFIVLNHHGNGGSTIGFCESICPKRSGELFIELAVFIAERIDTRKAFLRIDRLVIEFGPMFFALWAYHRVEPAATFAEIH
ncbi:hypothetical protein D3C86_1879160 [compost metagenome]